MTNEYSPLILISKYRNAVMGVAIIGVMLGHWFSLSQTPTDSIVLRLLSILPALVSTQGFLFISGYGIYYSFSKNSDSIAFYQRRFYRMLVPYMLMSVLYFLFCFCTREINFWQFIGRTTSLSYWFEGNYCGMWYVAVSTVLYAVSPLIFRIYFCRDSFVYTTLCLLATLLLAVIGNHLLFTFAPEQYELYYHGLERYFMFFIGLYCGYLSRQQSKEKTMGLSLMVALLPVAYLLTAFSPEYGYLTAATRRLVITIPLVSLFFALIDKVRFGQPIMQVFNWLGAYTFELYILHLLIYCFLTSEVLALPWSKTVCISVAIALALVLCAPVQRGIQFVIRNR